MADSLISDLPSIGGNLSLNDFIPISNSTKTSRATVDQVLSLNYMTIKGRIINNTSRTSGTLNLTQNGVSTNSSPGYFHLTGSLSATCRVDSSYFQPVPYSRGRLEITPVGGVRSVVGSHLNIPQLNTPSSTSIIYTVDLNNNCSALAYVNGSTAYNLNFSSFLGGVVEYPEDLIRYTTLFTWSFFPIA